MVEGLPPATTRGPHVGAKSLQHILLPVLAGVAVACASPSPIDGGLGPPTVTISANPTGVTNGQSSELTWSSTDATGCAASNGWSGIQATSGSVSVSPTATTTYTLTCTGDGGSDAASVTVTFSATPPPSITFTATPSAITAGQSSTLDWTTSGDTTCTASGGWSGTKATTGSESVSPATSTTYTLACGGIGGTTTKSVTVTVGVTPAPTVSLTPSPAAITAGQSSTLTWTTSNATSCTASGGTFTGTKPTNGSEQVSPVVTTQYTLACTGPGGSRSRSATVTVTAIPAPTVTLTPNPASIAPGGSSTLTWTTTNATSCTASGGSFTGTRPTSGSEQVSPAVTTVYGLSCDGPGGTGSRNATVTVTAIPAPTVTLTPNPASIAPGGSSTLTWTTTNATSCTASGGSFTGTRPTSGSEQVSPAVTTVYTLSCSGAGGSGSGMATVTVGITPPPGPYVYPLKVGSTGRYLVDQNDKPFFLSGDAAWSLIAQVSDADVDTYLASRKQLGFTFLIVELIEHQYANNAPANFYGDAPFTGKVFTTPNEAYFAHADRVIQAAAVQGMTVLLAPTYLGADCNTEGWCVEMKAASIADMTQWGQYLGNRYKNFDNLVWLIGGDTDPSVVKDRLLAVVAGIRQFDTRHLFTAHNGSPSLAIDPWPGQTWLTLDDYYQIAFPSYPEALRAYHVSPAMPFFFIEATYENSGVTQQQLRAQHYWSVLAGGFGHVFGNCPIWHFGSSAGSRYCSGTNWKGQLNSQGSLDMDRFQKLFTGRHWYNLVPDEGHVAVTAGLGSSGTESYVLAAYASDGSSIIAYLPTSRQVTVSGSRISGSTMTAWWYNPSTGVATSIGTYSTSGTQSFTPSGAGDWVLVVDSPAFGFPAPGS
jgi:Protein of unknown function (DUF4038)/Putative collagen-binding domain of a collagenase